MKKKKQTGRSAHEKMAAGNKKLITILSCIAAALLILVVALLLMIPQKQNEQPVPSTKPTVQTTVATEPVTEPTTEPTTVPPETEPEILGEFAELHEENPDFAGWIRIEGTVIDYPVMYTPEDGEKYIYANFKGNFNVNGLPFVDKNCSMDPESDNLIIYGHNMLSGEMFASLMKYANQEYWEKHPVIEFSTLYEHRRYEIIAAFYDRVYKKTEECFKFYKFIEVEDEAHFQEAMDYYKANSLIDTGVTGEYGDNLITLVTCAYHVRNGRFVVVAREIKAEESVQ